VRRGWRLALPLLAQLGTAGCAGGQTSTSAAPASFVRADTVELRRTLDSLASAHHGVLGYSLLNVDNTDAQTASAIHRGQYALANLLFNPTKQMMVGAEVQWGRRDNNFDGFGVSDFRIQFSAKMNFGHSWGGQ